MVGGKALEATEEMRIMEQEASEFSGFEHWLKTLVESDKSVLLIRAEKPGELMARFFTETREIKAAGGLVINPMGEILMMRRRGKWDLPKGKIEKGEFMRKAALREITEETGVSDLHILQTIKPTYHIYHENQSPVVKTTFWYFVECRDPENIKPQTDEDIEKIEWVHPADIKPYVSDTYPNIKMLLIMYAGIDKDFS